MMSVARSMFLPTVLGGFMVACGGDPEGTAVGEAMVRDSAGITIVENSAQSEALAPVWEVDPTPIVRIGVITGDVAYLFGRIDGVTQLSDGSIVALDATSRQLRYFGADGVHRLSVGREGEGPGEFAPGNGRLRLFRLPGDTLVVWHRPISNLDVGNFTFFDQTGDLAGTVSMAASAPVGFLVNRIMVGTTGQTGIHPPPREDGLATRNTTFWRLNLDSELPPETIEVREGERQWGVLVPGGPGGLMYYTIPFTYPPMTAVAGGRLAIGRSDNGEIVTYDSFGRPIRIVRMAVEPESLTPEQFQEAARPVFISESDPFAELAERALSEMPHLPHLPRYAPVRVSGTSRILMNDAGEIWMGRFRLDADELQWPSAAPSLWTAFNSDGQVAATIHLPPDFHPHQLTDEGVLGVLRDEFDVEYVLHLRVERTPPR